MVSVAIAAAAGAATGLAMAAWVRTGRYRKPGETARLRLVWAWVLVPLVALAWGLLTARSQSGAVLPADLAFAAAGAVLGWVDLDVHRVPDRLLLLAIAATALAALAGAGRAGEWSRLWTALLASAALVGLYLVLALLGSMGLGDVKLAGLTGLVLGLHGWSAVIVGTAAAVALAGLVGVALLLRRHSRSDHLAYGPAMIAGAVTALLAAAGR